MGRGDGVSVTWPGLSGGTVEGLVGRAILLGFMNGRIRHTAVTGVGSRLMCIMRATRERALARLVLPPRLSKSTRSSKHKSRKSSALKCWPCGMHNESAFANFW